MKRFVSFILQSIAWRVEFSPAKHEQSKQRKL